MSRRCFPIPTTEAFAARVQVGGTSYRVWGTPASEAGVKTRFLSDLQRRLVSPFCQARVGARKFQKVILTVSPRGISLQDADTKEMVENISIYRWAWHVGEPGCSPAASWRLVGS